MHSNQQKESAGQGRPKQYRLRSTEQFRACYDGGNRAGDDHLLLFAVASDAGHLRAGVSVSRKHGNAVQRNRKKRLLREAIRLVQHQLPPLDYVLVPRQTSNSTREDYQRSLVRLAKRLARRIERQEESSGD